MITVCLYVLFLVLYLPTPDYYYYHHRSIITLCLWDSQPAHPPVLPRQQPPAQTQHPSSRLFSSFSLFTKTDCEGTRRGARQRDGRGEEEEGGCVWISIKGPLNALYTTIYNQCSSMHSIEWDSLCLSVARLLFPFSFICSSAALLRLYYSSELHRHLLKRMLAGGPKTTAEFCFLCYLPAAPTFSFPAFPSPYL